METLAAAFFSIAGTRLHLEELQSNYSQQLTSLRDGLNQSLQRCGHPCGNVSLDGLAFSTNFSSVSSSRVWRPPQPLPQPPQPYDPRLSPQIPSVEQQLEALNGVSGSNIMADLEKVSGPPLHLGTGLDAPGAAGAVLQRGGLGRALLGVNCCCVEGCAGWMFALTGACPLSWPPLGAGMVRAGCWGNPGCPVPLGSGDGGDALLSPGLRAGTGDICCVPPNTG